NISFGKTLRGFTGFRNFLGRAMKSDKHQHIPKLSQVLFITRTAPRPTGKELEMKMVIDADAHANEPNDLFDRYLETEFKEHGPKVVQIGQVQYWMVEGKRLPRPVGTFGHGTPNGYLFKKGKPDMVINSPGLDDVQGRLQDLDKEGIDVQVAYPNIMAMASDLDDGDLAAAMSRAYNNYTAEKSQPFNGRVKGIAAVALQKPDEAAKE